MPDGVSYYIETLEIEKQKLLANSNGNKFLHGCPTDIRNISRRSKFKIEALSKFK